MRSRAMAVTVLFSLILISGFGCFRSTLAYFNDPLKAPSSLSSEQAKALAKKESLLRASRKIVDVRGNRKTTVFLALSGGGSRAAYFDTCCMFNLGAMLKEVDVISCVSGGSWAGAYYCITEDPAEIAKRQEEASATRSMLQFLQLDRMPYHEWEEQSVKRLLSQSFDWDFMVKWLHPGDTMRSWFTGWDRSDTMSEVFAEELFFIQPLPFRTIQTVVPTLLRHGYVMGELNPKRPYLVINATTAVSGPIFGKPFTFTREDFASIGSDIRSYPLSRAVMASSAFPAAMNYMTLRDYRGEAAIPHADRKRQYLHVFDGGVCDNLGLGSVGKAIKDMEKDLQKQGQTDHKYVIILVDAAVDSSGASPEDPDPRKKLMGMPADANFFSAFDILLETNSQRSIRMVKLILKSTSLGQRVRFLHLKFDDIPAGAVRLDSEGQAIQPRNDAKDGDKTQDLREAVNNVPTAFRLSDYNANVIEAATDELFRLKRAEIDALYKWATQK